MNAARSYPQPHQPALMSVSKNESTPTSQPFPFFQVLRYFKTFCRETPEVKAAHRSLFYYLLELVEQRGAARLKLDREAAMHGAGIGSKDAYTAGLKQLHAWGIIHYTPGANGYQAAIIEVLPKSSVPETGHYLGRYWDATQDTTGDATRTTKETIDLVTLTLEREARAQAEKKIGLLEKELQQLKASQAPASHTEGGAAEVATPVGPTPLAEGESIPGGFADPRLPDEDPRKWDARPRDEQMVQEYIDQYPDEAVRKRGQRKAHLFFEHYGSVGWQIMGRNGLVPIQNWRFLIRNFQFRESSPTSSHVTSTHRPATSRRNSQAARPGSTYQPLSEGLQAGAPLTGTLDDL